MNNFPERRQEETEDRCINDHVRKFARDESQLKIRDRVTESTSLTSITELIANIKKKVMMDKKDTLKKKKRNTLMLRRSRGGSASGVPGRSATRASNDERDSLDARDREQDDEREHSREDHC